MTTAIGAYATTALVKARIAQDSTFTAAEDTLIGTLCDQINQFIEGSAGAGRVIAPLAASTYTFDGVDSVRYGRRLYIKAGIRMITTLSIGSSTGQTPALVAAGDYFIGPRVQDRIPGWPGSYIQITNVASTAFWYAYGNVVVVGSANLTFGWAAIPDDLIDMALTTVARAWYSRQNGQADIVGSDETGAPLVSRFVAPHHWGILKSYRDPSIGTG